MQQSCPNDIFTTSIRLSTRKYLVQPSGDAKGKGDLPILVQTVNFGKKVSPTLCWCVMPLHWYPFDENAGKGVRSFGASWIQIEVGFCLQFEKPIWVEFGCKVYRFPCSMWILYTCFWVWVQKLSFAGNHRPSLFRQWPALILIYDN